MRIWVTGAGGFIGRHVVAQAALGGHEVCAIVRPGASSAVGQAGPVRAVPWPWTIPDPSSAPSRIRRPTPSSIWPGTRIRKTTWSRTSNLDSLVATLAFARAALSSGCRRMVGAGTCLEYADLPRSRVESDPARSPEPLRPVQARCAPRPRRALRTERRSVDLGAPVSHSRSRRAPGAPGAHAGSGAPRGPLVRAVAGPAAPRSPGRSRRRLGARPPRRAPDRRAPSTCVRGDRSRSRRSWRPSPAKSAAPRPCSSGSDHTVKVRS